MQFLLDKDGALRDSWTDLEFSATLTQLDGGWNLFYLGEFADYLLGPSASRRWQSKEPPAGKEDFEAKLQVGRSVDVLQGLSSISGLGQRRLIEVQMKSACAGGTGGALFALCWEAPILRAAQLWCVYRVSLPCAHAHPYATYVVRHADMSNF